MPPRYAYWTILVGDCRPRFARRSARICCRPSSGCKQKHPDVVMKWFARGQLWESPEAQRAAERPARPPADRERRGRSGGPADRIAIRAIGSSRSRARTVSAERARTAHGQIAHGQIAHGQIVPGQIVRVRIVRVNRIVRLATIAATVPPGRRRIAPGSIAKVVAARRPGAQGRPFAKPPGQVIRQAAEGRSFASLGRPFDKPQGRRLVSLRAGRSKPPGRSFDKPQGRPLDKPQGRPFDKPQGQAVRQASGQALRQASGQALRQASGQALRQRSGQAIRQASGQAVRQAPGQVVRQASGQALRQASGQAVREASGQAAERPAVAAQATSTSRRASRSTRPQGKPQDRARAVRGCRRTGQRHRRRPARKRSAKRKRARAARGW